MLKVILDSARQYQPHDRISHTPPIFINDEEVVPGTPALSVDGLDEPAHSNIAKPVIPKRHLLLLSAVTDAALTQQVDHHRDFVEQGTASLADVALTLAERRDHKSHRNYLIAGGDEIVDGQSVEASKDAPRVGWVFTGQGAQWPEMGAELIDTNGVFHETILKLDSFLAGLRIPLSWTIEGTFNFSLISLLKVHSNLRPQRNSAKRLVRAVSARLRWVTHSPSPSRLVSLMC
jgi:hypothetical protein